MWQPVGNTAGVGKIADGRPIRMENFSGTGGRGVLFDFPGDLRRDGLGRARASTREEHLRSSETQSSRLRPAGSLRFVSDLSVLVWSDYT